MRPYNSFSVRAFKKVLLITCRWDFRIFRHSNAESNALGEPLVKVSASEDNKVSVPSKGLRRSVLGRLENKCVKVGRVNVERICM